MNLSDLIRRAARAGPSKAALIFQGRSIGYAELDELVDTTAAALSRLGVAKGDRVAILAGNVPEFVSAFYAVLRLGAVGCPLNVGLTPEELGYILADAGAKAVVTELSLIPGVLAVRDRLADLQAVLVIGGPPAPPGTVSLEEALSDAGEAQEVTAQESDPALIAYTAGTTASPKGAVLSHGNLLANLKQMSAVPALAISPEDVVLLALPLFHIYALNATLGMAMASGATAVLVERFEPDATLELVERHGVTVLAGAPPMFAAWAGAEAMASMRSVRIAVSGAAPLPPSVLKAFRDRFGVTIWEGYGLTECGPAVTSTAVGGEARPGSIGLPLPGVDVQLVDERGEIVEEGDPGEVLVHGPNVFSGYWGRPGAEEDIFEGDWLRTGDIAFRDENGYLFLVDRKKDVIIVSGFNVFPTEVEEAIGRHPKVAEVAVVGVPDDRTGEAVRAWVVPVEGQAPAATEILGWLDGYLARFKWPRDVRIVDELPHHVTGKVLRRALREQEEERR